MVLGGIAGMTYSLALVIAGVLCLGGHCAGCSVWGWKRGVAECEEQPTRKA